MFNLIKPIKLESITRSEKNSGRVFLMSTQLMERSERKLLGELIPQLRKKFVPNFLQCLAAGIMIGYL